MTQAKLLLPRTRRRRDRFMRTLRALWHDSAALWTEFRTPILTLFIATFGGGLLYGELFFIARGERIPIYALPLEMVQLMAFQGISEEPIPSEPYLLAFWYIMPALGVYVIGRGAIDFVRIFFNRGERRRAWEEAVAATYRNHIIVLGVGKVGLRVIRHLAAMNFETVAIDSSIRPEIDEEFSQLGVPLISGDGRLTVTLEKAGIRDAQGLIVCTSSDQLNLEVTLRARDMNPTVRIVVRAWDTQFADQLKRFLDVDAVISSSEISAPAFAGAAVGIEIAHLMEIQGKSYSTIRLTVEPGSFLAGRTIDRLQNDHDMDIVLHERGGEVAVHPDDDIKVNVGDSLVIFARHSQIVDIAARNRSSH